MAQRTEKEETEFTVPAEKLTLYGGNNNNTTTATATTTTSAAASATSIAAMTLRCSSPETSSCSVEQNVKLPSPECISAPVTESTAIKRVVNRCFGCRKKVGLTGLRCRCGELFCGEHRYSDRHDCSYDYKAVGRKAIAKENPVVKASKIVRI